MDSFQSVLGDAAGGALCNVLSTYGSTAPLLTAISLVEPTPIGEALAVSAGLAGLAATYGCQWDPNGQGPPVSDYDGCQKVSSGWLTLWAGPGSPDNPSPDAIKVADNIVEILEFKNRINPQFGNWTVFYDVMQSFPPGSTPVRRSGTNDYNQGFLSLYTTLAPGSVCETSGSTKPPPPPTYTHTDPASGCELNVDFKGWGVDQAGNVNGVWQIAPAPTTRSSGGVIGGCNFAPTIYIDGGGGGQGGGGGPVTFPVPDPLPPDGDEPWWAPLARGAAQGLAAAAVQKAIDELFKTDYSGGSYELKGVCELDPDGNPMDVTRSTNYPPAPGLDAVLYRLDALAEMFQFNKELRQPTCKQQLTPVTGEAVTINWVSDEYSPNGNGPIRKLLTYFDQVGSTLEQTVAHWKDFTWNAGPVIVSVNGVPLGKPQVWAATAEEGKRVINHAAAIAGVDMTQADWLIMSPRSSRYGMSGLMRVRRSNNGVLGITKRDGPSGPPTGLT